jgi:uncharacterized protein (TIGR00290 family)
MPTDLRRSTADRALVSWSGGKDSCLAAVLARDAGLRLDRLVCMSEPDADRSRSHALPAWVLEAQARALGIALVQPRADWRDYESVFVEALRAARADGIEHAVFGDIDLVPHREWEEKVCAAADVRAHLPLWAWPRERVVAEIFARGIDAVCVCVNTRLLPAEFCGRAYDREFVRDLPPGVDACGENGEFHTCVLHAPGFAERVPVRIAGRREYVAPESQGADRYAYAELERA